MLGPLGVADRAVSVRIAAPGERIVLAALATWVGEVVSRDRLADALWRDEQPRSSAKVLQNIVLRLRKRLGHATIATRPGGYALDVPREAVDIHRFERLADDARRAAGQGDWSGADVAWAQARDLWTGTPLAELGDWEPAIAVRARVEEIHRELTEEQAEAELARGRHSQCIASLEAMVAAEPLRERRWSLLMLGLYRSGRQTDALRGYQRARDALADVGVEPGPQLRSLERAIAAQDPSLDPPSDDRRARRDGWYPGTFLLSDIVGSVHLWERDRAAMAEATARHDQIIEREVAAAGGELVAKQGEGDSTFSVFAHPAHALRAARAIQLAVVAETWATAEPMRVRVGVHTGDAQWRNDSWYGPVVNRAARLRSLASGGQTLVSGVAAGLVADSLPPGITLLYRGRRLLRGIERPEEVWELVTSGDRRPARSERRLPARTGAQGTRFVGRSAELEALTAWLDTEALVTVTGPGGIGKTRLAMELGDAVARHGHVVWVADLAPLRDPELVLTAVADAMGIEPGPNSQARHLEESASLVGVLVLDNCEHVLDACRPLVEQMLEAAPGIRVLATSRAPLQLSAERVWALQPLDERDAVQLLLDRARVIRSDLRLGADRDPSLTRICDALDGMPLAIELAAERLRSFSVEDLAARLDDQLTLLVRRRSSRRDDPRHSSLRMVFDWSYAQLTDDQKRLARRLSVFAGGFRLDAVEAVCGGDLDVLDGVDELVAQSMVTFDGGTARYRLLEPVRQYLAEQLNRTEEAASVQRSHARWVASLSRRLGRRAAENQASRSRRLREERSNVDLALGWCLANDPELAVEIAGSLGQYWHGYDMPSGRRWCETVLRMPVHTPRVRARALLGAGMVVQNDQAWDRSIGYLREAAALYDADGASAGYAASLYWLGRALDLRSVPRQQVHRDPEATHCYEECLRVCVDLGDHFSAAWCRIQLSASSFWAGNLERAEALNHEVVVDCSAAGLRHPVGQALNNLAYISHRRGDDTQAVDYLRESVRLYRELDAPWQLTDGLVDLALLEADLGHGAAGLELLAEALDVEDQIGVTPRRARKLAAAAYVHLARGDRAAATAAMGACLAHPWSSTMARLTPAGGYGGWLADAIQSAQAELDPAAVDAAAAHALPKDLVVLTEEIILRPASRATSLSFP